VLYDQLADRWLLSYFAFAEDANNNRCHLSTNACRV